MLYMVKTRKNRKNLKNLERKNKRFNIKIKGKPRIRKNNLEFDIQLIKKRVKKSKKINGGGGFYDECDITPLDHVDDLQRLITNATHRTSSLLLDSEVKELFSGTNNTTTYVICKDSATSEEPKLALRVYRYPVVINMDTNSCIFFHYSEYNFKNSEEINSIFNENILKEYRLQLQLCEQGVAPRIYSVFLEETNKLEQLMKISDSRDSRDSREKMKLKPSDLKNSEIFQPYTGTTKLFSLCSVMERVTLPEITEDYLEKMNELITQFSTVGIFLDIKPANTGMLGDRVTFIDFDTDFCATYEMLDIVKDESNEVFRKTKEFFRKIMVYIFYYFVLYHASSRLSPRLINKIFDHYLTPLIEVEDDEFLFMFSMLFGTQQLSTETKKSCLLKNLLFKEIYETYFLRINSPLVKKYPQQPIIKRFIKKVSTTEEFIFYDIDSMMRVDTPQLFRAKLPIRGRWTKPEYKFMHKLVVSEE